MDNLSNQSQKIKHQFEMKFKKNFKKYSQGFTLIELIIVVAIIGLLAAALFVAVDPAKRIGEARDAQRWADVTAILNAVLTYTVDNTTLPTEITSNMTAGTNYVISVGGSTDGGQYICPAISATAGQVKGILKPSLVSAFLATVPVDPSLDTRTVSSTGYYINRASSGRIKVGACHESTYATASIEVQR